MLNLAHNCNKQGRYVVVEKMASDVLSLLKDENKYSRRIIERMRRSYAVR